MSEQDEAKSISNPRLLSSVYFSLLAIIATIVIDTILYSIGVHPGLPFYQSILLSVIIAAIFGALFGKRIIFSDKAYWRHAFWWAFLMVLVALPFYDLGFFFLLTQNQEGLLVGSTAKGIIYMYFMILLYSFVLVGLWLAIFAGIAAVFLRGRFVYYLLHSLNERRRTQVKGEPVIKSSTVQHGQTTAELAEEDKGDTQ